jgi:hypothetical protein
VTLIAFADGYAPALLGDITSEGFASEAERNRGRSFLSFSAQMTPLASTRSRGGGSAPIGLIAASAGALLLGGLAFAVRRRRTASPVVGAAAPVVGAAAPQRCPACGQPSSGTAFCTQCGTRIM